MTEQWCPVCKLWVPDNEWHAFGRRHEDCAIHGGPVTDALHDAKMERLNREVEARLESMPKEWRKEYR